MNKNAQKMKNRPATSIVAFISFIYLVPSGVLVHFTENGMEKFHQFVGATHWTSAIIFLVAVIIHLVLNWKTMKRYMVTELKNLTVFRKQFIVISMVVTLVVFIFGIIELLES